MYLRFAFYSICDILEEHIISFIISDEENNGIRRNRFENYI